MYPGNADLCSFIPRKFYTRDAGTGLSRSKSGTGTDAGSPLRDSEAYGGFRQDYSKAL